jgi:GNAT superfamily N-acetyltransferase
LVRAADRPSGEVRSLHWPEARRDAANMHVVAELDAKIVGRAVLEAVYPPFAEIQNMHVVEPYRGRGAGSSLVNECIATAARMGFMAMFLQTHSECVPAQRLYVRKGFVLVGKAQMLRLVRFLNLPLLDAFLHTHPLSTYGASAGDADGEWSLTWCDWVTGDRLQLRLTGGTCDRDSKGLGPGLEALSFRKADAGLSAEVDGPTEATADGRASLQLRVTNTGAAPLRLRMRSLLPPGCEPRKPWQGLGPAEELAVGGSLASSVEVTLTDAIQRDVLQYAAFPSLPLTVEVLVGSTSFWLTHSIHVPA